MFRLIEHSYRHYSSVLIQVLTTSVVIILAGITSVADAQIDVTATTTFSGGLYQYDYTVTNNTIDDVLFVDVGVTPSPGIVQNLLAPAGFEAAFDPGLGLVTFLENTSSFGAAPQSGFTFDSPLAPTTTDFTATAFDPSFNEIFINGQTVGPVAMTPEPGELSLFAVLCISAGCLRFARVRRCRPNRQYLHQ